MKGTPQSGILPEDGAFGLFLTFSLNNAGALAPVLRRCRDIPGLTSDTGARDPRANLTSVVGFGWDLWQRLADVTSPSGFRNFTPIGTEPLQAPATGGDIFIHIHSGRHDLNFLLAREILQPIRQEIDVLDETHGFRYLDSRDLTGFIDGTENPQGAERAEAALIDNGDSAFTGGSFILAQRYVHDLEKWGRLAETEQEKVIGRTKPDSVELEDSEKPPTAHISRVVIEEQGEELEILRHSMPYGTVSREAGLFFLAYSKDISIFDKMLARMFGVSGDGLHDHLMDYTRPVSGAYFYAPPADILVSLS